MDCVTQRHNSCNYHSAVCVHCHPAQVIGTQRLYLVLPEASGGHCILQVQHDGDHKAMPGALPLHLRPA
jgi:hypothetical protein